MRRDGLYWVSFVGYVLSRSEDVGKGIEASARQLRCDVKRKRQSIVQMS
jgi:hypothetical protein